MSGQINQTSAEGNNLPRYHNEVIIDHLASNYVLGTLGDLVRKRTYRLSQLPQYRLLAERITYWENKLAPLNDEIPELAPKPQVWNNIEQAIAPADKQNSASVNSDEATSKASGWSIFGLSFNRLFGNGLVTAFSLLIAVVLGFSYIQQPDELGTLSYVAVMTDENEKPQVVAATYGESLTLMLDILELPDIDEEESFELWVTSKTDRQTRSLGVIPVGSDSFSRELTVAEWRLIKDSDSLLITVEELGGSSIGSPMGDTISRGLCIRLSGWQET
jgi:anti-sigma-K factor RskA